MNVCCAESVKLFLLASAAHDEGCDRTDKTEPPTVSNITGVFSSVVKTVVFIGAIQKSIGWANIWNSGSHQELAFCVLLAWRLTYKIVSFFVVVFCLRQRSVFFWAHKPASRTKLSKSSEGKFAHVPKWRCNFPASFKSLIHCTLLSQTNGLSNRRSFSISANEKNTFAWKKNFSQFVFWRKVLSQMKTEGPRVFTSISVCTRNRRKKCTNV